jgi:DNA-directed RNA polymerase specialized sigma24 family protein
MGYERDLERDKQALKNCLDQLSEKNHDLIRKRYFENRSYSELAGLFGRSVNALYVTFARLHTALERCMKLMRAS